MSTTFDNVANHDKPNKRRERQREELRWENEKENENCKNKNIFHDDYQSTNPEIKKHLHVP